MPGLWLSEWSSSAVERSDTSAHKFQGDSVPLICSPFLVTTRLQREMETTDQFNTDEPVQVSPVPSQSAAEREKRKLFKPSRYRIPIQDQLHKP